MAKIHLMKDFLLFLWKAKKLWLIPIFIILFLVSMIIILGEASALAPFIYTLF